MGKPHTVCLLLILFVFGRDCFFCGRIIALCKTAICIYMKANKCLKSFLQKGNCVLKDTHFHKIDLFLKEGSLLFEASEKKPLFKL